MEELYKDIKPIHKMQDIFNVSGHVIVIIGGAGKMGQQFAKTLALAGASIVLTDINLDACQEACERIAKETSGTIIPLKCDASNEDEIKDVFNTVHEKFGRLDSLICNAMAKPDGYYAPFKDHSIETFNAVLHGNLTSGFLASRAAVNYMKAGGSIVLTSSTYGVVGPDQRIYESCSTAANIYGGEHSLNAPASYCASKSGLIGLCKYLATLLGEKQIRVNALTPGGVFDGQEKGFHDEYTRRVPLGRMAEWTDYNGAILFLCSPASRYMTGSNLIVDGGWTAW